MQLWKQQNVLFTRGFIYVVCACRYPEPATRVLNNVITYVTPAEVGCARSNDDLSMCV